MIIDNSSFLSDMEIDIRNHFQTLTAFLDGYETSQLKELSVLLLSPAKKYSLILLEQILIKSDKKINLREILTMLISFIYFKSNILSFLETSIIP